MRIWSRSPSRQRELDEQFQALITLIPDPWSADELVRRVAVDRRRPIHLLTYPLTSEDPTGFWLTTAKADYIVVPEGSAGARRDAIIGHELAHIVLDHEPRPVTDQEGLSALAPNSSPGVVARFLPRQGYDVIREREAETIATRMIAFVHGRAQTTSAGTELNRLSSRLR
jgi:hypothetical protein